MKNTFKRALAIVITMLVFCGTVIADEKVLLSPTATAAIGDGISYIENFTVGSSSGYFTQDNLKIKPANENGFRIMAVGVPKDIPTHYTLIPAYPSFLNEGQDGAGAIENAAAIKSIRTTVMFNRPYDEIFLLISTSPNGPVKKIKLNPKDNAQVETMTEIEFVATEDDLKYNSNVATRDIVSEPIIGGPSTGIYFRGFEVKTNPPYGLHEYSEWSIVYIKDTVITYDKRFTDEQWETRKRLAEEWSIDDGRAVVTEKAVNEITYRKKLEATEIEKMHKDSVDSK